MTQITTSPARTRTAWSVIAALFFFPTGLAAVFQSGKTYAANRTGDYVGAHEGAAAARKWQNISAICFILLFVLNILAGGIWYN